jgi:Transaldolase/Fructose-6-phosphate aldolase
MNDHGYADTPLQQLTRLGQSVWIDWLSPDLLASGELQRLIAEHAVVGVTTNPTILERAITGSGAYDRQIRDLIAFGLSAHEIATELARADVSEAALQLLPVWQASGGADGYVSWEVSPALAWNPVATLAAVGLLHELIELPNLLVKIPATEPGLAAIEDSIAASYSIMRRSSSLLSVTARWLSRMCMGCGAPRMLGSICQRFTRSQVSSSRGSTAPPTSSSTSSGRPSPPHAEAFSESRAPSSPTATSGRSSADGAGRRCAREAPRPSACCGPRHRARTRPTEACVTSKVSSGRKR